MSDFKNHRVCGCEPRGMVRETRSPVGGIVRRQGQAKVADSAGNTHEVQQIKMLFTVKSSSRKLFSIFYSFCKKHGLEFREPRQNVPVAERWVDAETGEFVYDEVKRTRTMGAVYEIKGPAHVLYALSQMPCVVHVSAALSVSVPNGVGSPRFEKSVSIRTPARELFAGCPNVFVFVK